MNRISARQLYFFLGCIAPLGKIVILPAQLAMYAKNDLLFPALVNFLVQAAVIFCVLLLAKRDTSFFELLENTFGRVIATIIIGLFSLFLFYAALLPLMEQKLFVQSVFYDTLPSLLVFAPFFLFSVYVCTKPLGDYGRTWDILGPLSIIGIVGILILSVGSADYGALLPIGAGGGSGFLKGVSTAVSWFFDSAILLLLLGKIDYREGLAWKGTLCYLAGALAALFFIATYYGVFGETAMNQIFAFTKTSKYFAGITVLGRIDYVFIFLLSLVLAFWCTLPLQAGIECWLQAFGRKKYLPTLISIGVNLAFMVLLIFLDYRFGEVSRMIGGTLFWIFPIFCILLPPLCLLLRRNEHEVS